MIKRNIAFVLCFFLIAQTAFANTKPLPGYYIDLKGDTIQCNVEFNDWSINPTSIKIQANNNIKEFHPADIKGFGVYGFDNYLSVSVTYHTNPISGKDLPENFSDSTNTQACFLKVLMRGYYSLYELSTNIRAYYFIGYHDSTISELVYRVKVVNDSLVGDLSYKKGILNLLTQEGISAQNFDRVNHTIYNSSDIKSLIRILDENHNGVQYDRKHTGGFEAEIFLGGIRNSFPTSFKSIGTTNQFDPSYSFSGGLNLLFTFPGFFKALKIGLSVGYNGYNNKMTQAGSFTTHVSDGFHYTTTYADTITLKNSFMQSNLYVMYLFNPLGKINFYAKAGLNYNFSLTKKDESNVDSHYSGNVSGVKNGNVPLDYPIGSSENLILIKNSFLSYVIALGVKMNRSTLELSYWPSAQLANPANDGFVSRMDDFKLNRMAVYYYFSLFPGSKK